MKQLFKKIVGDYGSLLGLVALAAVLGVFSSGFLELSNLLNVLNQVSINGLVAIGMTFVIITGGIDLSVGSILALSGAILAAMLKAGVPGGAAICGAVLVGACLGAFNGFTISRFRLQPFIVTMATMTIYRGTTLVFTNGRPITGLGKDALYLAMGQGRFFGIPYNGLLFIFALCVTAYILSRTVFGKGVYAIGGNAEAARLSGISVQSTQIWSYVLSGAFAALAAVILVSRLDSAQPVAGQGYERDAIAAVVLGGTSLSGGRGMMVGTLIGALIIGVLNNGLNLMEVSAFYQQIVKGAVILLAVLMDQKK